MGRGSKDRALIRDAADSWLQELGEYIVPGVQTKQERKAYKKQLDALSAALLRDGQRRRNAAAHAGPSKRAFWLHFYGPAVWKLSDEFDLTTRQIAKRLADLTRENRRMIPEQIIEEYRRRMKEINAVPAGEGPAVAVQDPDPEVAPEPVVRFDWIEVEEQRRVRAAVIPTVELIAWCAKTGHDPKRFGPEQLRWFLDENGAKNWRERLTYGEWERGDYRLDNLTASPQEFVAESVGE